MRPKLLPDRDADLGHTRHNNLTKPSGLLSCEVFHKFIVLRPLSCGPQSEPFSACNFADEAHGQQPREATLGTIT